MTDRTVKHGPWDGYGAMGGHYCDLRHREHYDPCGCKCEGCTAARELRKADGGR